MPITRSVLPASVTLVDGVVYAGLGKIYALDAGTGTLLREYPVRSAHGNHIVAGGVLSVNVTEGMQGWVQAFAVSDGHELWRRAVRPILFCAPTSGDSVLYIARAVNAPEVPSLQALDAETGTLRWQAELPASSTSPLVASGGVVYASTHAGCVALNAADGTLLWRHDAHWLQSSVLCLLEHTLYISSTEWLRHRPSGRQPRQSRFHASIGALRTTDGELLWRQQLGTGTDAGSINAPAVAGGVVYVGADDGRLYALGAADGTVRWSCQTGGTRLSAPVVGDGRVYFGVNTGHVSALAAQDGAVLWQADTDVAISVAATIEIKGPSKIIGEGRP